MVGTEPVGTVVPLKAPPTARERIPKRPRTKRRRKSDLIAAAAAAAREAARAVEDTHATHASPESQSPARHAVPPRTLAVAVFALGLVTAAVGLYLNASFLWKFGRTSEAGLVLGVVGFATDGVTL